VKVTLPVGFVDPLMVGVTVAVKVTDWLTVDVEGTALSAVVVAAKPTGCSTVPVLVRKFVSPPYAALMV
jgi:hypothetical protein